MGFKISSNIPSQDLLNSVLRNINEDLSSLRADFKKLNDVVIVLSVKIEETKSIKDEIVQLFSKIETISNKIIDLEKMEEKLVFLIREVDKDRISANKISELLVDKRIGNMDIQIKDFNKKMPIVIKSIFLLALIICIILYVTKSYNDVFALIKILL